VSRLGILCLLIISFAGLAAAQDRPNASLFAAAGWGEPAAAAPAQAPSPTGGPLASDSPRWQVGISYAYLRLRTPLGSGNLNGFSTSVAYFVKDWVAIEGAVDPAWGSLSSAVQVHYLSYAGGPLFSFHRDSRLQPWFHGLFGGTHVNRSQPAGPASLNAFAMQAGGGADFALRPPFALRVQGDYVGTHLFSSWENSFEVKAGFVIVF